MYFAELRLCFRPMGRAMTVAVMRIKFALGVVNTFLLNVNKGMGTTYIIETV